MNLIHDPWIPVEFSDGTKARTGISDLLVGANRIRRLAMDSPIVTVSVFRLVLAVLIDALGVPLDVTEFKRRWDEGAFDADTTTEHCAGISGRFNLFDPIQPFGQVATLRSNKNETKSVAELLPHVPSGNNVTVFAVRTDGEPPRLEAEDAALWMITAQAYDTAGIKTGASGDPRVKRGKLTARLAPLGRIGTVIPIGRDLFETLMLNTPIIPDGDTVLGTPSWRRPVADEKGHARQIDGLLDLLTFESRRIRLVTDDSDDGTVTRVVLTTGDSMDVVPMEEPHTAWRAPTNPKPDDPPFRPVRHRSDRNAWQGLTSLLATAPQDGPGAYQSSVLLRQIDNLVQADVIPTDYPLEVMTVGVEYGNMQAIVENIIDDTIPLSVVALGSNDDVRELIEDVVTSVDSVSFALNQLDDALRSIHSGDAIPWDKGQRLAATFVHRVDPTVRRLLAGLRRDVSRCEEARPAWREIVVRIASQIAEDRLASAPLDAYAGTTNESGTDIRIGTIQRRFCHRLYKALEVFESPQIEEEPS